MRKGGRKTALFFLIEIIFNKDFQINVDQRPRYFFKMKYYKNRKHLIYYRTKKNLFTKK